MEHSPSTEESFFPHKKTFPGRELIIFSDNGIASLAKRCILRHKFFSFIHGMGLHFGRKFMLRKSPGKYAEAHIGKVDYFNDIIP